MEKAKRAGIPQGKKPMRLEPETLRLMRMDVVKCPSSKSERGME